MPDFRKQEIAYKRIFRLIYYLHADFLKIQTL